MMRLRRITSTTFNCCLSLFLYLNFSPSCPFVASFSVSKGHRKSHGRHLHQSADRRDSETPQKIFTNSRTRITSFHPSGQTHLSSVVLFDSSSSDDGSSPTFLPVVSKERALGISVLLTVPLAWGTYTPVIKYLYAIQPPVPGFVFSAAYYIVAAVSLWTLVSLQQSASDDNVNDKISTVDNSPVDGELQSTTTGNGITTLMGGLELGSYLFVGNVLQVIGLKTVPADRAGFLVQLTTVIVPLVQAASARDMKSISPKTWFSCFLAFVGVIIIDLDGKETQLIESTSQLESSATVGIFSGVQQVLSGFSGGDLLIILAAFVYSLHVVRLGRYAQATTPLKLAATKATTEAFLSLGLVTALASYTIAGTDGNINALVSFAAETGQEINTFFSSIIGSILSGAIPSSILFPAFGATLWTGWVTCAYTIYAQSFGQSRVSPTEANLIYTVQPLFTALFAWILIGETLGPAGVVGGSLIATAVYTVATSDQGTSEERILPETNVNR